MKKTLVIFAAIAIAACGVNAATKTEPNVVNFSTNVFLHDAPATPLHARLPTGLVMRVDGDVINPIQADYELRGNLTIETNKTLTMSYKPGVSAATNSVILSSEGYLTLRRWVSGTGWVENTLDPTNWPAAGASDASGWSEYPATQDVDIADGVITNISSLHFSDNQRIYVQGGNMYITIPSTGLSVDKPVSAQGLRSPYVRRVGTNNFVLGGDNHGGTAIRGGNIIITPNATGTQHGGPYTNFGYIIITNIPTSDPGVADALWRSGSNLYISTGP